MCKIRKPLTEFNVDKLGYSRPECKECRNMKRRAKYVENHQKELEYQKEYRECNKEKVSNYKRGYNKRNPDKIKNYARKYYLNNKEAISQKQHDKYIDNKEFYSEMNKLRRAEGKLMAIDNKHRDARKCLGHIPINDYFKGSVFHHLTINYGVFIPQDLHKSVWHCHRTNVGIVEINTLAMNWYRENI